MLERFLSYWNQNYHFAVSPNHYEIMANVWIAVLGTKYFVKYKYILFTKKPHNECRLHVSKSYPEFGLFNAATGCQQDKVVVLDNIIEKFFKNREVESCIIFQISQGVLSI